MTVVPGAMVNVGLQTVTLALLIVGLRYGVRTRRATRERGASASSARRAHMNLMTGAVAVSAAGVLIWMLPNFLLGWAYGTGPLGYGSGGYQSYLQYTGVLLPHWYLIAVHVVLGSIVSALGVYLVLRMRWRGFPRALSVRNYRALMIATWAMWFANIFVGYVILYFFAIAGTG